MSGQLTVHLRSFIHNCKLSSMKPELVCRASSNGVLILRGDNVQFYPKRERAKFPAKGMTEDELFIKHCLCGIKHLTPSEINCLSDEQIQNIIQLNKRAMTKIVRMKEEVAHKWSEVALRGFIQKGTKFSKEGGKDFYVKDFVINDIRELQLDIDIPRPVLIAELMRLRTTT